jgi:hypothetical protein
MHVEFVLGVVAVVLMVLKVWPLSLMLTGIVDAIFNGHECGVPSGGWDKHKQEDLTKRREMMARASDVGRGCCRQQFKHTDCRSSEGEQDKWVHTRETEREKKWHTLN